MARLARNFVIGLVAGGAALVAELVIDTLGTFLSFSDETLAASPLLIIVLFPFLEELFKYSALTKLADSDTPAPGLDSFLAVGAGFGTLEMLITFFVQNTGPTGALLPVITPFAVHIATAMVIGLSIRFLSLRRYPRVLALFPALSIHSAFNAWILLSA